MANLSDRALKKEKFSIDHQIEYMDDKGISFNFIKPKPAMTLLSNNSYYYKITSFRKNYSKDKSGRYINLDFGNLNDLATIDMHFRYLIIQLTLDIEHSLKAKLVNLITSDPKEDGYSIINEFEKYLEESFNKRNENNGKTYKNITNTIMDRNSDKYGYSIDLYTKRKKNPAIWVLIELMSYGELNNFIEFYVKSEKMGYNSFDKANKFLKSTKKMRNAAAHSRALLMNIVNGECINGVPIQVRAYAAKGNVNEYDIKKYFRNIKINDFCAILILHETYVVSENTKRIRKKELIKFAQRCRKNEIYYRIPCKTHSDFKNIFKIFIKLIDGYNK